MVYVALLRGINVGGNNIVAMADLRTAVEAAGMESVRTYINSGNVLFIARKTAPAKLARKLEEAIRAFSGLDIRVMVLDIAALRAIVGAIPGHWTNDAVMRCDVVFLAEEVDRPAVLDDLPYRPEIEDVVYLPGAVVWRIDRANATRSGLPKIIGTPFYKLVTIRNVNTARKLLALMDAM